MKPYAQAIRARAQHFYRSLRPLSLKAPAAAIFLYHTIEERESPWTKGHRYITPLHLFKRQINYLQKHFKLVSTGALVKALQQGPLQKSIAAIHFDDGVRSYVD